MRRIRQAISGMVLYRTVYALALSGIILFNLSLAQALAFGKQLFPFYIYVFYAALAVLWTLFTLFRSTGVEHDVSHKSSAALFTPGASVRLDQRLTFWLKRWLGLDGLMFMIGFVLSVVFAQSLWLAVLFWGGWMIWQERLGLKGQETLDWFKLSFMGGAVSGVLLLFFLMPPLKKTWLVALGMDAFGLLVMVVAGSALVEASLGRASRQEDQTYARYLGRFLKRNVLFIGLWLFLSALMVAFSFFVYWVFLDGLWPLISKGITAGLSWLVGEHRLPDLGVQRSFIQNNEPILRGDEGNDPLSLPNHESLWLKIALNIMRYLPEALLVSAMVMLIAFMIYKRRGKGSPWGELSSSEKQKLYVERRPHTSPKKEQQGWGERFKQFIKGRARTPLDDPLRKEVRHMLDDLRHLQSWYPGLTVRELAKRGILSDDTATVYEALRYGATVPDAKRLALAIQDIRRARLRLKADDPVTGSSDKVF